MTNYKFNILVLSGPNLNMLGIRELKEYGTLTLKEIIDHLTKEAISLNVKLDSIQSNSECEIINNIQEAKSNKVDFILINPAAFTHTSIAIRDALLTVNIPFIEVHFSNIYAREYFRQYSCISDIASGIICGLGTDGYSYALQAAVRYLLNSKIKKITEPTNGYS